MASIGKSLIGYPGAVALASLSWILAISASWNQSPTFDEPLHVNSGYIYWTKGDYRFQPDNGNLPQRWVSAPLLLDQVQLPSSDHPAWKEADHWQMSREFFFGELGNDPDHMMRLGRSMNALWAVATALLVYAWSRRLYGMAGGTLSLTLFAFCPLVLAHAGLATSDMCATFWFLACVGCWWRLLNHVTPGWSLLTGLSTGALFLAKHSAVLLLPMLALFILIRVWRCEPMKVGFHVLTTRVGQVCAILPLATAVMLAAGGVIWAFFDFRYSALPAEAPNDWVLSFGGWDELLKGPEKTLKVLNVARSLRALPEAYLYGFGLMVHFARQRNAFLHGEFGVEGWYYFFPYALAIKTPLTLFLIWFCAALLWRIRHCGEVRQALGKAIASSLPLWVMVAVYWAFALQSTLNIGVRHLLPTLPPLFILAGSLASGWQARQGSTGQYSNTPGIGVIRSPAWIARAAVLFLGLYVVEAVLTWPYYLAYFNQLVGGSSQGYRYLVDSSLDWGQDLPRLKTWLRDQDLELPQAPRVYLSYFGPGDPSHYRIRAELLPCYFDVYRRTALVPLHAGVYCISATNLQGVYLRFPERWNAEYEKVYRRLASWVAELDQAPPQRRAQMLDEEVSPPWTARLEYFDHLRFSRLCSYLRHRRPDANVGYSILIFRLTESELHQALWGPPVEWLDVRETVFYRQNARQRH